MYYSCHGSIITVSPATLGKTLLSRGQPADQQCRLRSSTFTVSFSSHIPILVVTDEDCKNSEGFLCC